MATVTRPTDALPDPGDALKAEPVRDHIANILTFIESNNIDSSNVDYSSTDGIMVLDQAQTVTGAKNFSTTILLSGSAVVDLNGIADSLVLDEDADTTISAPTDDQIDIEVGGSDLYKFTATAFVSGSNVVSDTTNTDSLGTTAITWSDLYLGDAAVLAFGEDQDVTLTHDPDDGIFLNAGMKLAFRDMGGEYIYSVSDGTLGIVAATEVDITTTTLDVNGAVDISGNTAIGGTLNVGASTAIANVKDEDNMSSNSATSLATQQSIKAYVDSQVAGADTLAELTDTAITSPSDAALLFYDTGTSTWKDNLMTGDASIADTGVLTLAGTIGGAKTWSGAAQFNSTITVGADDQGYDVKLFGDTASAYILWDTSADKLLTAGGATVDIVKDKLLIGGTAVTTTAAELNYLDTASAGTVVASKAVVVDSDKDISSFRNVTLTGELDAATGDFSGAVDIAGDLTLSAGTDGALRFSPASSIKIVDDSGVALVIEEADTAYMTFVTTDGSEAIKFDKALDINAATQVDNTITVGVDDAGHDVKFFGNAAGAYMEWDASADQLRIVGASADASTSTGKLLLATALNDINANDVIGKIEWQAPLEVGADAISVSASIKAIAQSTFTSSSNATDLVFSTGHSETAAEKFRITSQGELGIGGANYGSDGQVLTSGGAGAAPAWENAAGGNSFETIAVSGQSNVVADSATDTLTLAAGSNITLTTNAGTDTVTIAAGSSGHTIQEEGSSLTARTNLNFVGAGVTATDDSGNNATKVTVTPTGASLPLTRSDGSTSDPIALTSAALGENLVSDTTPQLGGNLDVNGQSIVSASNGNIQITPNGTGSVLVGVNGTGHDVKLFGDTSGKYLEWDQSADTLNVSGTLDIKENNITNVGDIAVDTISGDDDSNTTIGFPGSDVLTLNTGGSERVRVDASGRVGIGNAAMSSYTGDTSTLVVGDTGDGGASIKIAGSTSATQRYAFTDTADTTDQAYVSYNHGTGAMALATEGSDRVTIDSNGDVGIGLTDPTQRLHIKGQTAGNTLQGWAMIEGTGTGNDHTGWLFKTDAKTFTFGAAHANSSSVGANMMYWYESAGGVLMTLSSSGALSKSSGSFLIDHPLESMKDTHDLRHSFVEGPQADNIYRGTVTLSGGTATVNVDTAARMTDGTFAVLNGNVQAFTSNESGWDAVRGSVSGNVLTISSEDNTSTASVSWMVVGERKDQHMIDTEWTDSDGRVITEPEKRTTPFDEDNGEE